MGLALEILQALTTAIFALVVAVFFAITIYATRRSMPFAVTTESTSISEPVRYDGYICYIEKTGVNTVDVYVTPNEDCGLQAFDIQFKTSGNSFEVISHTGKDIQIHDNRIYSIANGLEVHIDANTPYKLATIIFPIKDEPYAVNITKADFAIAFTPMSPKMDDMYLEFPDIIIGE